MAADPCLLLFTLPIALTLMNELCWRDPVWAMYISCSTPLPSEYQCLELLGDLSDSLSLCAGERCWLTPLTGDALSLHLQESLPPTSHSGREQTHKPSPRHEWCWIWLFFVGITPNPLAWVCFRFWWVSELSVKLHPSQHFPFSKPGHIYQIQYQTQTRLSWFWAWNFQ